MGNGFSFREIQRRARSWQLRRRPTLGDGVPAKSRRRGVARDDAWIGGGDSNVEPAGLGGGLHGGIATNGWAGVDGDGDTTLGGSCVEAPLDGQALGSEVAGRREARVVAKIRRCLEGW